MELRLKNISKSYGEKEILSNINLTRCANKTCCASISLSCWKNAQKYMPPKITIAN